MTTVTELDHIAAINTNPDDDTPRLVYADWLDEQPGTKACVRCRNGRLYCPKCSGEGCSPYGVAANGPCLADQECEYCDGTGAVPDGRAARAAFIRVQCELASMRDDEGRPHPSGCLCQWCCTLRRRERELLAEHGPQWYEDWARRITGGTECASWSVEGPQPAGWMVFGGRWAVQRVPFVCGFVENFTCSAADWLRHADALAWRPGVTDECPGCGGTGYRDQVAAICYVCDSKSGRVHRPCPPTAQPIRKVVLTALPPGNPTWDDVLTQFRREWKWITFERAE